MEGAANKVRLTPHFHMVGQMWKQAANGVTLTPGHLHGRTNAEGLVT